MALVIAPEGTRADVKAWKTGFYNIALEAEVPVALGFIDYANKFGGLDGKLVPCGDYEADMETVADFYRTRVSRFNHPLTGESLEGDRSRSPARIGGFGTALWVLQGELR